jgi:hypothetical protein
MLLCVALLCFFGMVNRGGVKLSKSKGLYEPHSFLFSPVGPLSCMGFNRVNDSKGGLHNQWANDDVTGAPTGVKLLPNRYYHYKDQKGETQKGMAVPMMGASAHYIYKKDARSPSGNTKGKLVKKVPGTHKDCCKVLKQNGSVGPAIYDSSSELCYVYDFMELKPRAPLVIGADGPQGPSVTMDDIINQFPLYGKDGMSMVDIAELPPPPKGSSSYLIACGGEGQLPCQYHQGDKDVYAQAKSPTAYVGCSQDGWRQPPVTGKGTIVMKRTPVKNILPYGEDWTVCQNLPWIQSQGYQELTPGKWGWPTELPGWERPDPSAPFDINSSMVRFMTMEQA